MKIEAPPSWRLVFGAGLWLFTSVALLMGAGHPGDISRSAVWGACIFAAVGVLFAYAEMMRRSFQVEIDRDRGVVNIQRRNWWWRVVRENYALGRFNRVRSIFAMRGKYPKVRVELVEGNDSRALTLAVFTPKSYLSDHEPDEAAQLRRAIAACAAIEDGGFEGVQYPIAASVPDAEP